MRTVKRGIASFFLSAAWLSAQGSAGLFGTVTDPSGGLIAGATVTVKNAGTGAIRRTVTGGGGRYQVLSLPAGP